MRTFFVITISFLVASCFTWAVSTAIAAETRSNWATEAYLKNCNSVVFIQGDKIEERRGGALDSERTFNGMGTGIIIDERGYIITNYHVVKDIRQIHVKTYDQRDYIATVVSKDDDTDLAIIKINPKTPLSPIVFGRSHDLMPGESCIAIGNPYGYMFSLTDGRIGAINREVGVGNSTLVYRQSIQMNTEINPGNSGGPLINVLGEMIGINFAIRQGASGIAFATPVDQVVEIAAKLLGEVVDKQISHGVSVTQVEPLNYDVVKRFGIIVEFVESNSPAGLAGLQRGDIITGIGEYTLRNKLDFYRALIDLKGDDEIAFSFLRNKERMEVAFAVKTARGGVVAQKNVSPPPVNSTLANSTPRPATNRTATNRVESTAPANESRVARATAEQDKLIWQNLGIRYEAIPLQEFETTYQQFLAQFNGGIVVQAVRDGSPAALADLAPGDVIVGIGPWEVTTANNIRWIGGQEWSRLQSENENLPANVIRDNTHYHTIFKIR